MRSCTRRYRHKSHRGKNISEHVCVINTSERASVHTCVCVNRYSFLPHSHRCVDIIVHSCHAAAAIGMYAGIIRTRLAGFAIFKPCDYVIHLQTSNYCMLQYARIIIISSYLASENIDTPNAFR